MSRHVLPGNCRGDSSEFQNLPWLGPCSRCVPLLCESRTNWYLVPDWKALILIHKQQTLSVSQTRTMINQFCDYIRKVNTIFSNVYFQGEGKLFAENKIYPIHDVISIIHSVLTLRTWKKAQPFALLVHHVPLARSGLAGAQRRSFPHQESDQYGNWGCPVPHRVPLRLVGFDV